jgi:hypothetical protein
VDAHRGHQEILNNPDKGLTFRETVSSSAEINRFKKIILLYPS